MKALFDTHIVIDYLQGKPEAKRELEQYDAPLISAYSVAELLAAATPEEAVILAAFFKRFEVVACDGAVAQLAAMLARSHGIGMEQAIIWASARQQGALLVTRNAKAYPTGEAGFRLPY